MKYGGNLLKRTGSLFTGYDGSPITDFNASGSSLSQVNVTVGDSINFYDLSTKNPTSWNWNFGNGTPSVSNVQNPTGITFNTTGTTTISLTTSNSFGTNIKTKTNYINVQSISLKKLAININAAPFGGLSVIPYYSNYTWTPSGMTQRTWTWNMLSSNILGAVPTSACTMALKYTDNTYSNYFVRIMSMFSASYNNGKTASNTGIYPDDVLQYSLVNYSYPLTDQIIRISGLTTSTTYKMTMLPSKSGGSPATSKYTITGGTNKDGTSVTLECIDNIMNTVSVSNITPSSNGIIDINVTYTLTGASIGVINAIEIDEGG